MKFFIAYIFIFSFISNGKTDDYKSILQKKQEHEAQECFEKLAAEYKESGKSTQMLEGKISTTLTIDDIGKISDFQIDESSVLSPEVFEMCIRIPLESTDFPKPPKKSKIKIKHTFSFKEKK